MKATDLLAALKLCRSSLSTTDFVPVLAHFCFTGEQVYAYNDISAVVADIETGIHGALRGDALLGVLGTLSGEITLTQEKEHVVLKYGRNRSKLAALSKDALIFHTPEEEEEFSIHVDDDLVAGIARCTDTVGINAMHREFLGVCFSLEGGNALHIYSTDDTRLSHYRVDEENIPEGTEAKPAKWLVPAAACKQIVDLWAATKDTRGKSDTQATLLFTKHWAILLLDSVCLFSKLMPEEPPDYAAMVKQIAPANNAWQGKPEGLTDALRRAEVLTAKDEQPCVRLQCVGPQLIVSVEGAALGDLSDNFKLLQPANGIDLYFQAERLRAACDGADTMAFSPRCMGFTSGFYRCFVAPLPAPKE